RVVLAFSMKEGTPWLWVVLSGLITLALGVIILLHWPVSGLYILGIFLGIDLVFAGVSWICVGLGLRKLTTWRIDGLRSRRATSLLNDISLVSPSVRRIARTNRTRGPRQYCAR